MILNGVIKALGKGNWQKEFNLGPNGLPISFFAVLAYLPFYFICVKAAVKYNAVEGHVPFLAIAMILTLMSLSFPLIAYIFTMLFDRLSVFRPWVIVRNWTMLFVVMAMSLGFGLYLINLAPFSLAYIFGLFLYLATLVVDIRLALRVGEFDWGLAVFAAILINLTAMMILMMGLTQTL